MSGGCGPKRGFDRGNKDTTKIMGRVFFVPLKKMHFEWIGKERQCAVLRPEDQRPPYLRDV